MGGLVGKIKKIENNQDSYSLHIENTSTTLQNSLLTNNRNKMLKSSSSEPTSLSFSQTVIEHQIELRETQNTGKQKWYEKVWFNPESNFIIIFKCITLLLIYLYFFQIPIAMVFQHRNQDSEIFFRVINVPAMSIFIIGILVQIKTSYYNEGILISNPKDILINYFKYNFIFDLFSVASIVIYEISEMLRDEEIERQIEYKFIVILFYLKVPQLIRIQSFIISSFDLKRRIKAFFKLTLLLLKIFMLTNIAASGFFWISYNYCQDYFHDDRCWINDFQVEGRDIKISQWTVQYAFSLYWASTTMLTIGYGDITPKNIQEVTFTIAAQFISCVLFAFSVNEIWGIIQQKNSKKSKIYSRMNVMNVYMRDKNISTHLKSRINAYLSHFYHTKNLRQKDLESQIIEELTPSLKKELYYESYGFLFKSHVFFTNFSGEFLEKVSENIREVGLFEEQRVYTPKMEEHISLYYISKGELQSFVDFNQPKIKNISLELFEAGKIFGLYEFIRQLNYQSSLIANKYSLLYVLDYENWNNCIRDYDTDFQKFFLFKHKAQYEKNLTNLMVKCLICQSNNHQSDACLQEQIEARNKDFLTEYLKPAYRRPYKRRNKYDNHLDQKVVSLQGLTGSFIKTRKLSTSVSYNRKQSLKKANKKSIFHSKTHSQKMSKIVLRQKTRRSMMFDDDSDQKQEIANTIFQTIQTVQNYDIYWPQANATTDWGRERRRATLLQNRIRRQ